jgi:hypothetical protein
MVISSGIKMGKYIDMEAFQLLNMLMEDESGIKMR